jgi:Holliday junction DNA helicase RuvB
MTRERVVTPEAAPEEKEFDWGLRPRSLQEYIGQPETVERLGIAIEAAKKRGEKLDHLLLHGPPGLGKCITADSLILTGAGLVEFQTMIRAGMAADSSQPVEAQVYGINGLEPASHIYASGRVPTRRIRTRSGFALEGTPHHPVLVATPEGPQWKPLGELTTSDHVAIGRGMNVWGKTQRATWTPDAARDRRENSELLVSQLHAGLSDEPGRFSTTVEMRRAYSHVRGGGPTLTVEKTAQRLELPLLDGRRLDKSSPRCWKTKNRALVPQQEYSLVLDGDMAYLLGVLVGDGHIAKGSVAPVCVITCEESPMQVELQRICRAHFGTSPQVHKYGDKAARLNFSQSQGKVFLEFGITPVNARDKTVPHTVLTGTKSVAVGFLQGLFDADGHVWKDGIEFGTRSERLSQQVQLLLANFGIIAQRKAKLVKGENFWVLFIGGQDAVSFYEKIGFRLERKQACAAALHARERGWSRSDLVPGANPLLSALLRKSQPQSRAVHKAFDHIKRDDHVLTRRQIVKCLSLLPDAVRAEPEYQTLQALADPLFHWDPVVATSSSEAEAFDFVVPGTHSFIANGFINHNTTLAYIMAEELGREIAITSGPALERPGDVMGFLVNANEGDIIFIDEIHRLPRVVEEFLYSAMEDYVVNFSLDKGMYSKPLPFKLAKFTLIGATTRPAMLTRPLRDRFGIQQHFDFYGHEELLRIARRSAHLLNVRLENDGANELAWRARGTPRIVNRLLARVRDYAQVRAEGIITREVAAAALKLEGIDEMGLDRLDRAALTVIKDTYDGGPVGIEALAATLNEEVDTLVDVVEPYLLKIGFLARTPAGRRITRRAYEHLGEPPPPSAISAQPSLLDEAFDATEALRAKARRAEGKETKRG